MKKHSVQVRLLLAAVCWAILVSVSGAAQSAILVGASSADINPPNGICMGGYGKNRLTTGVHDDLYAKAVVFDDGKTPIALVAVDSIGVPYADVKKIRAEASSRVTDIALPPERIIISSTHSHSTPDMSGLWGPDFKTTGRDAGYVAKLVDTVANQIVLAVQNRKPAKLMYAVTKCHGWAVNVIDPGVFDFSVTVLQCVDEQGETIATLTNYACHPTILDDPNTLASADWIGYFYKRMSDALPGEHLYLQGAIGGWVQPFNYRRTFGVAEEYGSDLAKKTLAALKQAEPLNASEIHFARKVFQIPLENAMFRKLFEAGIVPGQLTGQNGENVETEVAWFAVGGAEFATHPGETSPAFSLKTKALMKGEPKFILGLGLDQLGYIIEKEKFGKNPFEYNSQVSVGKEAGPMMMEALASIIP